MWYLPHMVLVVPPEELYATQLTQLQEMGFFDTQENIRALRATSGNVHAAVDRLLGNPGQWAYFQKEMKKEIPIQLYIIMSFLFNWKIYLWTCKIRQFGTRVLWRWQRESGQLVGFAFLVACENKRNTKETQTQMWSSNEFGDIRAYIYTHKYVCIAGLFDSCPSPSSFVINLIMYISTSFF